MSKTKAGTRTVTYHGPRAAIRVGGRMLRRGVATVVSEAVAVEALTDRRVTETATTTDTATVKEGRDGS